MQMSSFLVHDGVPAAQVLKHTVTFAAAAPATAFVTFIASSASATFETRRSHAVLGMYSTASHCLLLCS
jgi:hypothetical protein